MKKVPKLRNLEIEEAKRILDEEEIKYEDEIKKSFSILKIDRIVKTDPKEGSNLNKNDKLVLYKSRGLLPLLLPVLVLILLGLTFTYGSDIYKNIADQIMITGIKAPKIVVKETGIKTNGIACDKDFVLQLEEPNVKNGIAYYEYCINDTKGTKGCEWKTTTTNNIVVSENGHKYVSVRIIDEKSNSY